MTLLPRPVAREATTEAHRALLRRPRLAARRAPAVCGPLRPRPRPLEWPMRGRCRLQSHPPRKRASSWLPGTALRSLTVPRVRGTAPLRPNSTPRPSPRGRPTGALPFPRTLRAAPPRRPLGGRRPSKGPCATFRGSARNSAVPWLRSRRDKGPLSSASKPLRRTWLLFLPPLPPLAPPRSRRCKLRCPKRCIFNAICSHPRNACCLPARA